MQKTLQIVFINEAIIYQRKMLAKSNVQINLLNDGYWFYAYLTFAV